MNTRREFLKTSAVGLFGLMSMSDFSKLYGKNTAGKNTPRFIFLRKSNGIRPEWLNPPSMGKVDSNKAMDVDLDKHELPEWMQPINKHKENLTILQNLSAKMCAMGHRTFQSPLAVCKAAERISTIKRASVDVELGRMFASPFGHIELSCARNAKGVIRGMSSLGPQQPNYAFASPSAAVKNLFVLASDDKNSQMNNEMNGDLHKFISANIKPQNQHVKDQLERLKLNNYAESVDSLISRNKQLVSMTAEIKKHVPKLNQKIMSDDYTTIEQQQAFVDVLLSSLYAGLTNSITFNLDTLQTEYTGLFKGQTIHLHDVGHGKDSEGVPEMTVRNKLRTHHMSLVNSIVEGLKSMPEGNGTMFDNTIVMYLPENGEKHHSNGSHVPYLVLSGKNVKLDIAGRFIQLPAYNQPGHKTIGNWYTTILNAYGNPVEHYGDLDVGLKIDQKGPISQFQKQSI
jgi:hypothetical protein